MKGWGKDRVKAAIGRDFNKIKLWLPLQNAEGWVFGWTAINYADNLITRGPACWYYYFYGHRELNALIAFPQFGQGGHRPDMRGMDGLIKQTFTAECTHTEPKKRASECETIIGTIGKGRVLFPITSERASTLGNGVRAFKLEILGLLCAMSCRCHLLRIPAKIS